MKDPLELSLGRLRRRIALAAFGGALSRHLLVFALATGAVALLLRAGLFVDRSDAALVLLAAAAAPVTAYRTARRRFLSPGGAAAWLDVKSGSSGRILTELERGDPRWRKEAERALERASGPPRVRARAMLSRTALGAAFASFALLVPIPRTPLTPRANLHEASIETLREKLETLEEVVGLEEETREELEARLERLEQEADASRNAEATFEAIDRFEERLEDEALAGVEAVEQASEQLAQAATSFEENPDEAEALAREALAELSESGLVGTLPAELTENLPLPTATLPEGTELDPEALREAAGRIDEALAEQMERLTREGLLDAGELGRLSELGELSSLNPGELASLEGFEFSEHQCDESCGKPGGGT